jgi:hypothetical protein
MLKCPFGGTFQHLTSSVAIATEVGAGSAAYPDTTQLGPCHSITLSLPSHFLREKELGEKMVKMVKIRPLAPTLTFWLYSYRESDK